MVKNNNFKRKPKNGIIEPRINQELKIYDTIRLIYKDEATDENQSKIMSIDEAFALSEKHSLDLIEINGNTMPPIVKLYDYSKYLFDLKKASKNKAKSNNVCKEIQLSVSISQHDLEIKANKAKDFIKDGNKVKVVLTMRGRELGRRDYSKECFNKFIELMSDVAVCESTPRDEGNKVIVILKKK